MFTRLAFILAWLHQVANYGTQVAYYGTKTT